MVTDNVICKCKDTIPGYLNKRNAFWNFEILSVGSNFLS